MPGGMVYDLTVAFSLVTGSAAGLLSLLTWEAFRRSPFGRAVFLLSIVMVLFVVYHVLVLVSPPDPVLALGCESALFTGVAVFIWALVWSQRQLRSRPSGGNGP